MTPGNFRSVSWRRVLKEADGSECPHSKVIEVLNSINVLKTKGEIRRTKVPTRVKWLFEAVKASGYEHGPRLSLAMVNEILQEYSLAGKATTGVYHP